MNKLVLTRTGGLALNGTVIEKLLGFHIKSNGCDSPTITMQFDVDDFEIEVGVADFEWAEEWISYRNARATAQNESDGEAESGFEKLDDTGANTLIQNMMDMGLTHSEALESLDKCKARIFKHTLIESDKNDLLKNALHPAWRG